MRVNKVWSHTIASDSMLWTDLRLKKPRNPGRYFAKFLQKNRGIKTFVIEDLSAFALSSLKLQQLFYSSPGLKRLRLVAANKPLALSPAFQGNLGKDLAHLTHLSLVRIAHNYALIVELLRLSSPSLEVLDVIDDSPLASVALLVPMLKLKKLRLACESQRKDSIEMVCTVLPRVPTCAD